MSIANTDRTSTLLALAFALAGCGATPVAETTPELRDESAAELDVASEQLEADQHPPEQEATEVLWVLARPSYEQFDQNLLRVHRVDSSPEGAFESSIRVSGLPDDATGMLRVRLSPEGPPVMRAAGPMPATRQILEVLEQSNEVGPGAHLAPGFNIDGVNLQLPTEFRESNAPTLTHADGSIRVDVEEVQVVSVGRGDDRRQYRIGEPLETLLAILPGCGEPNVARGGTSVECEGVRVMQGGPVAGHNITVEVFAQ